MKTFYTSLAVIVIAILLDPQATKAQTNCTDDLIIDNCTTFENSYLSSNSISTQGILNIESNQSIEYISNSIRLNEGFSAIIGSDFQIRIGSCEYIAPPIYNFCTEIYPRPDCSGDEPVGGVIQIAFMNEKLWDIGQTLKVRFFGGSNFVKQKVMQFAEEWENFANINFEFVSSGNSEIRITFENSGSWSYVGTDALFRSQDVATMNFGWFNDNTSDTEFRRTVLHEFGHALGAIHEHQSPDASIPWNVPAVYDYYYRTQGWDKAKVDNNIFNRYDESIISNSSYDSESIMHYRIPNSLTIGDFEVGWNTSLSTTDENFIGTIYPFSGCSIDGEVCENGGTCIRGICDCLPGYSGNNCEIENACIGIDCQNGGTCSGGSCDCPSGFSGNNCEIENACIGVDCQNGGTCSGGSCDCPSGFSGNNCETENACIGIVCQNGGNCINGECNCPPGFIGDSCEISSQPPEACFLWFQEICNGLECRVEFNASCSAPLTNINIFSWDFGDGSTDLILCRTANRCNSNTLCSDGIRCCCIDHIYEQPGNYDVVLTVENSEGQISSETIRILVGD